LTAGALTIYGEGIMRRLIFFSFIALTGCNPSAGSLIQDPAVVADLQDIARRVPQDDACVTLAKSVLQANFASALNHASDHPAPNVVGTWVATNCNETDSNTFPNQVPCQVTITWSEESNGSITQANVGAATQGQGDVATIVGTSTPDTAYIVQENHATGEGCEQDLVNVIALGPLKGGTRGEITLTLVRSSSCAAAKWACSAGGFQRS
jgi:hypothetical protein